MQIEQETITYTTLNLSGANYKYVPQTTLNDKYQSLELLYSIPPDKAFIRLVQLCLSDRYLYQHPHLRKKVLENVKGYVSIGQILRLPYLSNFVKQINQGLLPSKSQILQLIRSFHKTCKVRANLREIRRKQPFFNKLKQIKPLYIEEYPENDGCQQLQILLQATCNIYKIKYNHDQNWAIIYAQFPQKIIALHGHIWSISTKLKVQNFQKTSNSFNATNVSEGLNNYQKLYINNKFQKDTDNYNGYQQRGMPKPKSNKKNHRQPFANQKHVGYKNRQIRNQMSDEDSQDQNSMNSDSDDDKEVYRSENEDQQDYDDEAQMNLYRKKEVQKDLHYQKMRMNLHQLKIKAQNQSEFSQILRRQSPIQQQQMMGRIRQFQNDRLLDKIKKKKSQTGRRHNQNKDKDKKQSKFRIKNVKQQNYEFNQSFFNQININAQQQCQLRLPTDVQEYIDGLIRVANQNLDTNGLMTMIDGVQLYWDGQDEESMDLQY